MKQVICTLLLFIVLSSCQNSFDKKVRVVLSEMIDSEVNLPYEKMKLLSGHDMIDTNNEKLKIIMYIDSTRCSPCTISSIPRWNDFITIHKEKVDLIVILATRSIDSETLEYPFGDIESSIRVYWDTAYIFRELNIRPLQEEFFSTVLIDQDNKIKVVGNPINNDMVKQLYLNQMNLSN